MYFQYHKGADLFPLIDTGTPGPNGKKVYLCSSSLESPAITPRCRRQRPISTSSAPPSLSTLQGPTSPPGCSGFFCSPNSTNRSNASLLRTYPRCNI